MAIQKKEIKAFVSGTHNTLSDELIPNDAASSSHGWLTKDGKIELMYGRQAVGAEGTSGKNYAEHFGYKTDGTSVHFRKVDTVVQYLNGTTWTDVITGLTASDMTFTNYSSLAGNFVYIGSPDDGLFKIVTANPGSYTDVYDSAKNFKGYFFIDKGRSIMWNTATDSTGLYGSYIDSQDSDVYTTVAAEAIGSLGSTNYTGTLAFKAGGSTRTCFGAVFTDGTTSLTVDFTGNVTDASAGSGTLNFTTGAYDITFDATTVGAVTCTYQWEDSNASGVTDFTKSATRLAGEGFVVRQDVGGDAIQAVIPHDGSYFSMKENSVYQFTLDILDLNPTNLIVRTDVGISSLRAATATGAGIVFMNTGNPSDPQVNILKRNPVGDNFDVQPLFSQFKFENYQYTDVTVVPWDKFVVIACKEGTAENNRLLLCDMHENTVDVSTYGVRTLAKDAGLLYGGDPLSKTTYELFSGFDDMGTVVDNSWESAGELYGTSSLKKTKKFIFRGDISPNQSIGVYVEVDDGGYPHVGTILGSGDYVDYSASYAVGTTFIGEDTIGGGSDNQVYQFLMGLKIRLPKFRKRKIKFVALGYGYCAMQQITDFDIWQYEDKLPKKYRTKQNVSLDGATTDEDTPTY